LTPAGLRGHAPPPSLITFGAVVTLARSKKPPRGRDPMPEREKSNAGQRPATATCPSCRIAVQPDARYCHGCGASLHSQPERKRLDRKTVALVIAGAAGAAAVAIVAGLFLSQYKAAPSLSPPPATDGSAAMPAPAIDLSSMTPREAADRLFNRVMMASEQGNTEEAQQFVPMALQAYGRVAELDADAHYHMGRIYMVAGDIENARKQIAILKQFAPNHLLGLLLEHTIAEQLGDRDAAASAKAAFAAAYDAEVKTGKTEYRDHKVSIEKFRSGAASPMIDFSGSTLPAVAPQGATLFADKCARCHGQNAAGSDKGPPLVHKIYEPSHHGDEAFYRAVQQGVQGHHWPFGNMAPIEGVSDDEIGQIIAYVRALQVASGIR